MLIEFSVLLVIYKSCVGHGFREGEKKEKRREIYGRMVEQLRLELIFSIHIEIHSVHLLFVNLHKYSLHTSNFTAINIMYMDT